MCESVFALEQTLQDSLCATSSNFKNTMNFLHNYSDTFATELRGRVSSPHDEQSRVSQEGRVSSPHDEQSMVSPRFLKEGMSVQEQVDFILKEAT